MTSSKSLDAYDLVKIALADAYDLVKITSSMVDAYDLVKIVVSNDIS